MHSAEPQVYASLGNPSESGAQQEDELLAEIGNWQEDIDVLLDANQPTQGVEEVNIGELPSQLADWCKCASTEAASSLAKKAGGLLPRNPPVNLQKLRRRSSGSSTNVAKSKHKAGSGGWLSAPISSTWSLLSSLRPKGSTPDKRSSQSGRDSKVARSERYHGGDEVPGGGLHRRKSEVFVDRRKPDNVRRSSSYVETSHHASQSDAKRATSTRPHRRACSSMDGVSDDGGERASREDSRGVGSTGHESRREEGDSAQRSFRRSSSGKEKSERDRALGNQEETLQTQLLRMPYYLFQGLVLITFVTDKVADMDSLSNVRKRVLVCVMVLSIGNFFSSTTTARSNVLFRVLRSVCDVFNISHAVLLILLGIWSPALSEHGRNLATWLAQFPSLAVLLGISQPRLGPILGTFNLITGLLRVAADLQIDTHPLPSELPVVVTGLVLLVIIPANVYIPDPLELESGASACAGSGSACAGSGPWPVAKPAPSGGGGAAAGGLGLEAMSELPWCSCHVLTTSLVVALLNLGAPPQRALGAPLMVMILNFVWSSSVAFAGVLSGPAALPWPGLPFFTTLSVLSLLISKHLLV